MTTLTDAQVTAVRDGILGLDYESIKPEAVDVVDVDGPEGESVLVTVRLANRTTADEWSPDDFRSVRREARTIAMEALDARDIRVIYESGSASDEEDRSTESGDKHVDDDAR